MDKQERVTREMVGGDTVTHREVVHDVSTPPSAIVAQRVVYFVFGFIITILALRMLLLLLAANQGNSFVDFVYGLSNVFAAPFYGIFNYEPAYGNFVFEVSSLVAIAVYALLGWGIARLLTLGSNHPEAA